METNVEARIFGAERIYFYKEQELLPNFIINKFRETDSEVVLQGGNTEENKLYNCVFEKSNPLPDKVIKMTKDENIYFLGNIRAVRTYSTRELKFYYLNYKPNVPFFTTEVNHIIELKNYLLFVNPKGNSYLVNRKGDIKQTSDFADISPSGDNDIFKDATTNKYYYVDKYEKLQNITDIISYLNDDNLEKIYDYNHDLIVFYNKELVLFSDILFYENIKDSVREVLFSNIKAVSRISDTCYALLDKDSHIIFYDISNKQIKIVDLTFPYGVSISGMLDFNVYYMNNYIYFFFRNISTHKNTKLIFKMD